MDEKEDILKAAIKKLREIEHKNDKEDSIGEAFVEDGERSYRNITRLQAPDQWPDPPEDFEE